MSYPADTMRAFELLPKESQLYNLGDNDAASYHYWARFKGRKITAVARSADPDDDTSGERYNKRSGRWIADPEVLRKANHGKNWAPISAAEAEVATAAKMGPAPTSAYPRFHFASALDGARFMVIADLDYDYTGWSVEVVHNEEVHIGQVLSTSTWQVDERDRNLLGLGLPTTGWAAVIEPGAIPKAFITPDGTRIELDTWAYMVEWLAESLINQPVALIIDLGPSDYVPSEHDADDVPCAQLQVMADDVFMVRRSRTELGHLMLADYSAAGVTLDMWYLQDHFDDCTDGYMFTTDRRLAAETCVTWFRDNQGADATGEIGCDYRYADELLP